MNKRLLLLAMILTGSLLVRASSPTTGAYNYQFPSGVTPADYMANTIVMKVRPDFRSICSPNNIENPIVQKVLALVNTPQLKKMFPFHQPPATATNEWGMKMEDLSLIYELSYFGTSDLIKNINLLLSSGILEYAEPKFIPKTQFTPNDPNISQQQFLTKIDAYGAWNINQGDTNVVIGITDTGTDPDHPDLAANLKHNYADPINGIDDDNDGYTDNFSGWDLGEIDNNTTCGASAHGSHVSGCADAVTNNGTGVASPGFNCKFLPVKIADATGALTKAYEGITYAADHGCQVINCSWGGSGGGALGQTIINYATINMNSLVVAAAGNNGVNQEFFPAAYKNVLSVAATNNSDVKSSFSNYGGFIDVCAPGSNIYSTIYDNTYSPQSGTSMASPIVAGCAAIVKSQNPSFNAFQIGEQLRVTADNIYPVNSGYPDLLGTGRVNLYNALIFTSPSVRANNLAFTDNNDNAFVANDTVRITGDFTNYLDPTVNLNVTLTTTSPYVTILDGVTAVGVLGTMATVNNLSDPFTVKISPTAPQNAVIPLKLTFADGLYSGIQLFSITVNVDYINITINDVATSNTSKGRLCYNGESQTEGLGFNYLNNGTLDYEAGFMVGVAGQVSDNCRGTGTGSDNDFQSVQSIQRNDPPIWSDFDTYGKFSDAIAPLPLGVAVRHRSVTWADAPDQKYHIFEYTILNNSGTTINSLCAGIFADWDIQVYANNKADEDANNKMGYVYCTDPGGYYAGIKLLTTGAFHHTAIDNIAGAGGINMQDGFDDNEKYQSMSTGRTQAGVTGAGNDVCDVVGSGPFTINNGDSVKVAFALIAGDDLAQLQTSAVSAQIKYDLLTAISTATNPALVTANPYPNPAGNEVIIPLYLDRNASILLEIFDAQGKLVYTERKESMIQGENQWKVSLAGMQSGVYQYRLSGKPGQVSGVIQKK